MPKIRGIKPDYWTDEDIVDLSIPARLLFIGLWSYACDNGHLQDKSKQIKMRIFPGDDVNCADLLRELEASGRIERGDGWITIPNLTEHQKPDLRYFATCDKEGCEDPPEKVAQRAARRAHAGRTEGAQGANGVRTPGAHVDGDGDGDGDGDVKVMVKGDKPRASRGTQIPDTWQPNESHSSFAAEQRVNLDAEHDKFRDWAKANGKVMKDWDAAFRNWLRNSTKYRTPEEAKPPRVLPTAAQVEEPPDGLTPEQYRDWHAEQRAKRQRA